jgi:hypothetical protein
VAGGKEWARAPPVVTTRVGSAIDPNWFRSLGSLLPFQLPLPPMRLLAVGIELADDVAI